MDTGKDGRPGRNLKTGTFLKGHIPHNAGKPWNEWMPEDAQKRVAEIGRKNLRVNKSLWGANKRAVVCVNEKTGEYKYCESATKAAKIVGHDHTNITACCRGKRKHCGGFRWFYFDSNEWIELVKRIKCAENV